MGRGASDQTAAGANVRRNSGLLKKAQLQTSQRTISEVVRMAGLDADPPLDLNPPYQRGAVWSPDQKVNLIKSVLLGLPIGGVFINNRDQSGWSQPLRVVDGQQRMRALSEFMNDQVEIPTAWVDDRGQDPYPAVPEDYNADTITYGQLTLRGQRSFKGHTIAVHESTVPTEKDEAELYLLINFGGVAQTDEDRSRAATVAQQAAPPEPTGGPGLERSELPESDRGLDRDREDPSPPPVPVKNRVYGAIAKNSDIVDRDAHLGPRETIKPMTHMAVFIMDDDTTAYREYSTHDSAEGARDALRNPPAGFVPEYVIDLEAPIDAGSVYQVYADDIDAVYEGEPVPFDEDHVAFA